MTKIVRFSCLALYLMTTFTMLSGCQMYSADSNSSSSSASTDQNAAPAISYLRLAPSAPPMPQAETRPTLDDPRTQYWRPGYWSYDNGSFNWVPGEIIARPSPTAVWAPAYWVHHNYGWGLVAGAWQ